jgi:riboflavin kinase/FMN adenylyltransferase
MAHHRWGWREEVPASCRGLTWAIGNFDGAHLGHAALVQCLVRLAASLGTRPAVLTFDPHPLAILRPGEAPRALTTADDRAEHLQALGASEVLTLQTCPELLRLSAPEFFTEVLQRRLAVRGLCEGPNFRFGRGREGDLHLLERLCAEAGIPLEEAPWQALGGEAVSSSRIREALDAGDVELAARLLGRRYRLRGVVTEGARRGRTLGFPTANLADTQTVVPGEGVYAAAAWAEGKAWPAAVNVGANPTFGEVERKVEAHLCGYQGDLYGQEVALDFVTKLRDTARFPGPEALVAQLSRDVAEAQRIVGGGA